MHARHQELHDALFGLPGLCQALEDAQVRFVSVAPSGGWFVERAGVVQVLPESLDPSLVAALTRAVARIAASTGRDGLLEGWALRLVGGGDGATLVAERRPQPAIGPASTDAIEALSRAASGGVNGLVLGLPGAPVADVLMWIARLIEARPLAYVGAVAPVRLLGAHAHHYYPPDDATARRALDALLRRCRAVLWEGPAGPDEIALAAGAHARSHCWWGMETRDVVASLGALGRQRASRSAAAPAVPGMLVVVQPPSPGRAYHGPEIVYLARRAERGWEEVVGHDAAIVAALVALERGAGAAPLDESLDGPPTGEIDLRDPYLEELLAAERVPDRQLREETRSDINVSQFLARRSGLRVNDAMLRQSGEIDLQALMAGRERGPGEHVGGGGLARESSVPEAMSTEALRREAARHRTGDQRTGDQGSAPRSIDYGDVELIELDRAPVDQDQALAAAQASILPGGELEQALPGLNIDFDDVDSYAVHPDQLRHTVEQEIDVVALRDELWRVVSRERSEGTEDVASKPSPAPMQRVLRPGTNPAGEPRVARRDDGSPPRSDSHRALKSSPRIIPSSPTGRKTDE